MQKILFDFIVWVFRKRLTIIISEILVFIFAVIYTFSIVVPQFSSSVSFFLPNTSRSSSLLGLASVMTGGSINTGSNIDPSQIEILFNTVNYKKNFIEYMGLIERYELQKNANPLLNAIKVLDRNLTFEVTEKGSIASTELISFTITYFDVNPDSAFIGVKYLYNSLDSLIREISVSRAVLEQQYFLENIHKTSLLLDSLKMSFIDFQNENNLFSMAAQRDATISVQAQLLMNKISLMINYNELLAKYGSRNSSVIEIKNKITAIDNVMKSLPTDTNAILLKSLSEMNYYKYLEYLKDIEFYTNLNLFLRNQYEQAYLRVNNDLSTLQLVDDAIRPVYKSRPKRIFTLAAVMFVYNFALFSVLATIFGYGLVKKKGYLNAFFKAI